MKTIVVYGMLLALVASVAVQAQAPAGGEFRVNNATASSQARPSVAADGSGRFVVAWSNSYGAIKARRFDAAGAPLGPDFIVNAGPVLPGTRTGVSADDRGRFVVVWEGVDGFGTGIYGQRFDASGARLGEQFRANTYTADNQYRPQAAMLAGGAFVVIWGSTGGDGSGYAIFAQAFGSTGAPVFPFDFRVNSYTTGNQSAPAVAALGGNRYVVTWTSAGQDGSQYGAFGQRMDGILGTGGEFRINSYTTGSQATAAVVRGAQDGFVALWQGPPGTGFPLWGRRFDAAGAPQGADFVVNTFTPVPPSQVGAAADAVGDFTVTWDAGLIPQVAGARFDPAGVPRGAVFQVNTYTTLVGAPFSSIASDPSGNLLVTWMSNQFSGSRFDIYGQRFGGLLPAGLAVTDGGNGVLEVPDDFALVTSWRNVSGAAQTFQGRASDVVAPAGLVLTLSLDANYGTVANGASGSCGSQCFAGGLLGTRPAGHVDLTLLERILPDLQGQARRWSVHVGDSFSDVPRTNPFYRSVETLLHHGVTAGCAANTYCPTSPTTREQMAAFVLSAKEGPSYVPRVCNTPLFNDVPASSPFCRWIDELARRGVVSGCGGGAYCPGAVVTREQMAVFVLRTLDPLLNPPVCTTPVFNDVPASSPFCRWIEELARRGVVSGCGGGNYCPTAAVTREQMSVFLVGTFGLTLYGP